MLGLALDQFQGQCNIRSLHPVKKHKGQAKGRQNDAYVYCFVSRPLASWPRNFCSFMQRLCSLRDLINDIARCSGILGIRILPGRDELNLGLRENLCTSYFILLLAIDSRLCFSQPGGLTDNIERYRRATQLRDNR
jgi:hypothetical protein